MADRANPHHALAGYLLGVLTPEEASAFEQHLRGCRQCREEKAELGGLPDMLRIAAVTEPPPGLRQRTFGAIAAAARAPLRPAPGAPAPGPPGLGPAATGPPAPGPAAPGPAAPGPPEPGRTAPGSGPWPVQRPPQAQPPAPDSGPWPVQRPPRVQPPQAQRPQAQPPQAQPPGAERPAEPTQRLQRPRQPAQGSDEATAPNVIPMRARRHMPRWLLATAAALIVVAAVGLAGVQWLRGSGDGNVTTIALSKGDVGNGQGEARIRTVPAGWEVQLQVSGLPPNGPDNHYECWFVGPGDTEQTPNRVAVGSFVVRADGSANVTMISAADPARYPKMGVTLERNDGNPARNGPKALVSP